MKKIEIRDFKIKLNKEKVLHNLGCFEGSAIYDTVSGYFDEMENTLYSLLEPCAVAVFEGMRAYCLITLGSGVSEMSENFFDSGEGMKGILADTMADEYIFAMDNVLSERIKLEGATGNFGIKKRLDAPKDLPLANQRIILEKCGIENVGVTSGFMFEPVKTFGYILELTDDRDMFNAQHDCSKCRNFDCPRRNTTAKGDFEILSAYDYTPGMKSGESAVCIDIGTTTVAFELVTDKGTVKTYKTINPQRRFGLDVLSRIEAANRGRGKELASAIRYTLRNGYREVTNGFGNTDKVVIAGNTTMIHLLMNYPCIKLGEYPFKSEHLDVIKTAFDAAGHTDKIEIVIYGGISAFVGGDIVSGLYMCDFDKSDKVNFFIDIGTNGEMAIGDSKKIVVTSAAAGPAFEGGRISCGMGSIDGAVCGVDLKKGTLKTIGGKPPAGICGTGIIELISEFIDNKIIDNTGLLRGDYFKNGYKVCNGVVFNQNDIRQAQMAKAAVRAGIECLMKEYGVSCDDIATVYLAGGFGYGLSVKKACNMGILPHGFEGKTKVIGNSSLGGCVKYCCENDGMERINHIKAISEDFPLGNNADFEKMYIEYMNF